MIFRKRERDDPRLELTGLVDVIFLLIIFFTVTTTFATTGGMDVNLPEASAQRPLDKVHKFYVVVDRQGKAFVEGEEATDLELRAAFKAMVAKEKDTLVIVQADKAAYHGRVVAIMDMAQSAGLKRLAIATEKPPEERE